MVASDDAPQEKSKFCLMTFLFFWLFQSVIFILPLLFGKNTGLASADMFSMASLFKTTRKK